MVRIGLKEGMRTAPVAALIVAKKAMTFRKRNASYERGYFSARFAMFKRRGEAGNFKGPFKPVIPFEMNLLGAFGQASTVLPGVSRML